jgi:hypothetical protein
VRKQWAWIKKSWTMWFSTALLAAPDLLAFLPTVREYFSADFYIWAFRVVVVLFILLRLKTQLQAQDKATK